MLEVASLLLPFVKDVFDSVEGNQDPDIVKAKISVLQSQIESLDKVNAAQAQVNAVEAASESLFVAGWRPLAGWTSCFVVMVYPILVHVWNYFAIIHSMPPMPIMDGSTYTPILVGMLGLTFSNTAEKIGKVK